MSAAADMGAPAATPKCDGCHRKPGALEHNYEGEVVACDDCNYTLCSMCVGHSCTAQQQDVQRAASRQ